jgi:hypothetical protein
MQGRIVTFSLDAIAKSRLHATLCRTTVAASRWHERQNQYVVSGGSGFDGATLSGQTATDNEYVGVDQL